MNRIQLELNSAFLIHGDSPVVTRHGFDTESWWSMPWMIWTGRFWCFYPGGSARFSAHISRRCHRGTSFGIRFLMILVYGHHVNPVDFDGRTTKPNCWGPLGWGHLMIAASLVAFQDSSLVQMKAGLLHFCGFWMLLIFLILEIHIFTFSTDSPQILHRFLGYTSKYPEIICRITSQAEGRSTRMWGRDLTWEPSGDEAILKTYVICMYKTCVVYMYV